MPAQLPQFKSELFNRIVQGDVNVLKEEHDFTLIEPIYYPTFREELNDGIRTKSIIYAEENSEKWDVLSVTCAAGHLNLVEQLLGMPLVSANAAADNDNTALRWAAINGHLEVVNRLLEIDAVMANAAVMNNEALRVAAQSGHIDVVNRLLKINEVSANAAVMNNEALIMAAENGHSEVAHAIAKAQWPLGRQDMPEEMQQYLPIIKAGAQLYTAKREQERILIRALQNKPVLGTKSLYASSSLVNDPRAHRLFTLPGDVVDSIASYAGHKRQS
ncbi:MAG: ankyrin repeat domain-containing protein [Pseudomonadota bacterium]|nr:ankyrin repeat domain-containing protein [Pseudomonadota bacterium]MEC8977792.1 ankyrin repeat domain-containing protein [Pseudomonadota bacterium]